MCAMNFRTGFQRLFAVLSVGWVAVVLLTQGPNMPPRPASAVVETGLKALGFEPEPLSWRAQSRTHFVIWLGALSLVPPALAYFLFFLTLPWIYRGFRA